MKAPVSLCLIVKNDESCLEKCLLSFRDYVEEIVVVDTGSTDKTPEIAQKYADIFEVYTACNDSDGKIESFSQARNRSFELARQKWIMWVDSDDIVVGTDKLKAIIETAEQGDQIKTHDVVSFMFPYEYAYDNTGQVICLHYRERLFSNKNGVHFVNPVHEVVVPKENKSIVFNINEDVIYKHQRQYLNKPTESGRNLRILKKYVEKVGTSDARQLYYLGLEYFNAGELDEAVKSLTQYISLSGWEDEINMACLKMVDICCMRADYKEGLKWAFKAIEVKENWGEGYFALSKLFYYLAQQGGPHEMRNWEKCAFFAKTGLCLPPTKTLLFVNPFDREYTIHLYLNLALSKLGDTQGALDSCITGLMKVPTDGMLLANKKLYETFLEKNKAILAVNNLVTIGDIDPDTSSLVVSLLNKTKTKDAAFYPLTHPVFPVAETSTNPNCWNIPSTWDFEGFPLKLTKEQLQATVIAIWKQYMLHDEVLSALSFLENAPYVVKHTRETEKILEMTKATIAWMKDSNLAQKINSPANAQVEAGWPLPHALPSLSQEANRFNLVLDHLEPAPKSLVDFGSMDGCFTNRFGMKGYEVTGLDLSVSSCALANKKALEFNTGARHIVTYFKDAVDKVSPHSFDYATSTDTYEHLMDPVNEMLIPAKKMLKPDGKFLLVTPHGAWMRGEYLDWAHPWLWAKENGSNWLAPNPRAHLIAPSVWTVAKHFRQAGYWVKNCYVSLCEGAKDVEGQGNVFAEACLHGPVTEKPLDIILFAGDGLENWTPETFKKTGLGGSETMLLEQAKRLAALGHSVRVYNSCGEHGEGIYDGVEYYHTAKFQDETCDVLIVSRRTDMLADTYGVKAKLKLLWVHDIFALAATNETMLKADRILALSNWHKSFMVQAHVVHPEHIITTRNAIDLKRFDKKIERNKFKCINSSSPDRSLPVLLDIWPRIKQQVPEAELHVYYGFSNWEKSAAHDQKQMELIASLKTRLSDMKNLGVVFHDRISQEELSKEFLSAGVMLYPTWFSETSFIGGMECTAAGVRFVGSSIAAINETIGERGTLIDGEWTSKEYQDKFVEEAVKVINKAGDEDRAALQKYAKRNFGFDALAKDWESMFYTLIEEKKMNPIIPYMPTDEYRK